MSNVRTACGVSHVEPGSDGLGHLVCPAWRDTTDELINAHVEFNH